MARGRQLTSTRNWKMRKAQGTSQQRWRAKCYSNTSVCLLARNEPASSADEQNAIQTRLFACWQGTSQPAALTSKMLFKHVCLFVCLFASFCKPVNLLPIAGTSGRSVHFPSDIGKTTHCFLGQSPTTYQLVHDWFPFVRWSVKTHDDSGVHFWVAQIRDIIITKFCYSCFVNGSMVFLTPYCACLRVRDTVP